MRVPFEGTYRLTQGFGENPGSYSRFGMQGHNGLDYATPDSTQILSPIEGKVVEALLDQNGYGLYLKIENDGEGSILAHLKEYRVGLGDHVKEGQVVALSNNTGNSTGPHLHWGYYRKPRDRSNGYAGYIDQAGLLDHTTMVEVDSATFENLVTKSTAYDNMLPELERVKHLLSENERVNAEKTVIIGDLRSKLEECENKEIPIPVPEVPEIPESPPEEQPEPPVPLPVENWFTRLKKWLLS